MNKQRGFLLNPFRFGGGAPASLSVVSTAGTVKTTSETSHAITMPASIVSGNLLVAFVLTGQTGYAVTPSAGWTELTTSSNGTLMKCFYKTAAGGDSLTITVALNRRLSARVFNIAGWSALYGRDWAAASTSNPNPPPLTPAGGSAEYIWIVTAGANDYVGVTSPSATYGDVTTDLTDTGTTDSAALVTQRKIATESSDDPGLIAMNGGSKPWSGSFVAVK